MVIETSPKLEMVELPVAELALNPANPRTMDGDQAGALDASVMQFGFVQPVVARAADHTVISGHQRLRTAMRLGLPTVPVILVNVDAVGAQVLSLALNRISGSWDQPLLARWLDDLSRDATADLRLTGFGEDEVKLLLATMQQRERAGQPESFDLDAALALARGTRTSAGEIWQLGRHLLAVGDCLDATLVKRLLGDRRAAMTFADPPYQVAYGDHGGQSKSGKRRRMKNDTLEGEAAAAFVAGWATLVVERTDGAIYVCMSSKEWPRVAAALEAAGGHWSDTLIWTKDRFTLGRADYQRGYEPIWYGWPEARKRHWCGDRDQSDVWSFDRPSASPLHPTAKPLGLVERAIRNSSHADDLVFDPFGGSGTTLIAADRAGRRCAMVELDPVYADVILARYEAYSGETAVRLEPEADVP